MTKINSFNDEKDGNKEVGQLLDLMAAYQKSQILFTFVELCISALLRDETLSAAEFARKLNIDPLAMERFLNASVNVGLLCRETDGYANSRMTANLLVKDEPFYLGGQVARHRERSSAVWAQLTDRLCEWQYGGQEKSVPDADDQNAQAMTEQHNLALLHGFALAKTLDFSKHRRILDLGGGTGATSIALCRSYPQLKSTIFDLPENIEIARSFVEKERLQSRIEFAAGDFKKDAMPDDFDVVLLANLMTVADAEENIKLLKKLYEKMPAGSACLISGWILDDTQLAPDLTVLFCLEDICWNAPDVERSEAIYSGWLKSAGFADIKCETYLEPTKILYGIKP